MSAELGERSAPVDAAQLDDDPLRALVRSGRTGARRPARRPAPARARRPRRALRAAGGAARRRGGGARATPRRRLTTLGRDGPDQARANGSTPSRTGRGADRGVARRSSRSSENDDISELADYDQHPADTATDTFEREKDLSILEQLEAELAELEAALARVDDGTYGIDEVTGEPIDPERLDALPTARTNIEPDDGTSPLSVTGPAVRAGPRGRRPIARRATTATSTTSARLLDDLRAATATSSPRCSTTPTSGSTATSPSTATPPSSHDGDEVAVLPARQRRVAPRCGGGTGAEGAQWRDAA